MQVFRLIDIEFLVIANTLEEAKDILFNQTTINFEGDDTTAFEWEAVPDTELIELSWGEELDSSEYQDSDSFGVFTKDEDDFYREVSLPAKAWASLLGAGMFAAQLHGGCGGTFEGGYQRVMWGIGRTPKAA